MGTAVDHLVSAIEALPERASNDDVQAAFAAADRLAAWLSTALDGVDPAADGAATLAQWLRCRARRSHRDAAALVKRTARLRACPDVRAAWSDGRFATGHVDAVVACVSDRRQPIFAEHEAELVPTLARLTVPQTERALRQWAAYADALVDTPPADASERAVYLSPGVDGWGELSGRLDPAGFAVVDAALDAAVVADAAGEPARTRAQQRADALVAVARHFLDHADGGATTRGSRPDVAVVVTLDELERRAGRTIDGEPLDPVSVGALLCDAGVHRIVTDGASVVLDAGRTTRTVGHALFRALAVRDRRVPVPRLRPPGVTLRGASRRAVAARGGTDQSNLVLLCWRHHHDFAHHPQWHLKLLPDATVKVTKPDGQVLTSHSGHRAAPIPARPDDRKPFGRVDRASMAPN